MVVLSAAVCTKQGKTLLARQFINMPRTRIEGLLAAFGKLVSDSSDRQHTYIETDSVRYVFQSMETLYLLLITNKASNIVEDLETLRLISKVVPEYCGGGMISEEVVQKNAFDLIFAFDEVISLGYRENITIQQIRTNLEMDSHEETLHDMIEASKMQEAKEEAKKRAKAIKKEKRERAKTGISSSKMQGIGSDSISSSSTFLSSNDRRDTRNVEYNNDRGSNNNDYRDDPPPKRTARKGKGLKLGGKKKGKDSFLSKMKQEDGLRDLKSNMQADGVAADNAVTAGAGGQMVQDDQIRVLLEEKLNISMKSDGSIDIMEVKGTLAVVCNDPECGKVQIQLAADSVGQAGDNGFQFKTNPNMSKNDFLKNSLLCLKNKNRDYPTGKPTTVLRWRFSSNDDSSIPFTINSWPEADNGGKMNVNVEYSLEREDVTLENVQILIPLGTTSAAPQITTCDVGSHRHNSRKGFLEWNIDYIDSSNGSANLEFTIDGDSEEMYFPVQVNFMSKDLLSGVSVDEAVVDGKEDELLYKVASRLVVDNYVIDYD
jgi:coatomer subunit delta